MSQLQNFETHSVTTTSGIKIGYRKTGKGSALILLHGGLQSSANFTDLAMALSDDFTAYVPDRRGRGLSDPYGDEDGLAEETEDLLALIRHVQAEYIFALSSGAVITLQAVLKGAILKKVALYEPPLPPDESVFNKLDRDYNKAMQKGNSGRAFIALMKTLDDPSFSLLKSLPALLTAPVINLMMRAQAKGNNKEEPTLKDLVAAFYHDRIIIRDAISADLAGQAKQVKTYVLLLEGGKSQPFLRQTIGRLIRTIPGAKHVKFPEQGHLAADNTGAPKAVAHELLKFFKE